MLAVSLINITLSHTVCILAGDPYRICLLAVNPYTLVLLGQLAVTLPGPMDEVRCLGGRQQVSFPAGYERNTFDVTSNTWGSQGG